MSFIINDNSALRAFAFAAISAKRFKLEVLRGATKQKTSKYSVSASQQCVTLS
jgi:hypothetical protein